uniref:Methyltransferase DDB_G0268948-like n=1 Tax=Saccoglossus kowalevskii TaxID=10224 RepID=A0ABM0LWN0_SACKO
KTGPYTLAVDIGCGNGHSTTHFAQHFEQIIGFDASQEQVKAANDSNEFSNIQYKFGRAENIPIESQTVDLVSVANCAHWFENIDIFYKEVERVLKPGGCLAIYGYGDLKLHHETKSEALQAIYDE